MNSTRMPKITNNPHRYSTPVAARLGPSAASMPYYSTRGGPAMATGYYEALPSSTAQAPMTVSSYDPYAVAPLSIPPTSTTVSSNHSLPAQHRDVTGPWNPKKDELLLQARAGGMNWADIQKSYFPDKSSNACRKRHERLIASKSTNDWDQRKTERIAKEYMSMRKEIWTPLAARTGEKWSVVEQKCMSSGIKNLQAAARACTRRERIEAGHPVPYDDDSGIDGIGLTPVDEDADPSYNSPAGSSGAGSSTSHTYSGGPMYSQNSYQGYYGGGHHGYTSSVSSMATAQGHSGDEAAYMTHGNHLSSVDMGIDAIINRPRDREMPQ